MATKTTPPAEPEAPAPDPAQAPQPGNRFFSWMRGLGLTRQPGWIGGVCAGIAGRLGIDPLIVRGIVVVVAVVGGPALLLYAAAWLLLPDDKDKIHLEELIRGRLESPLAGIGAMVLLSLLPIAQGIWYTGALYWGRPAWGDSLGRAIWTLVVLAAIVVFVAWVARRSSATSEPVVIPATTDDRPETIPQPVSVAPTVAAPPTAAPRAPAAGAPEEEVAAWRAQQEAWKAEREAFRASQAQAARETARQRAQESRERHHASLAAAAERRRLRRLENPRLSAAIVFTVLGGAIVAGGIAAAAASVEAPTPTLPASVGLAVSTAVMGAAIVVGGVLRHRSGFLSFLAGVTLLSALLVTAAPTSRILVPPVTYGVGVGDYAQPLGNALMTVYPGMPEGDTDLWQGAGTVSIDVGDGTAAIVEVLSPSSAVTVWSQTVLGKGDGGPVFGMEPRPVEPQRRADGLQRWLITVGDPDATEVRTIRIWQNSGYVEIYDQNVPELEGELQ
jgi:phage shock protein PspC (stress-responsive transcriptional regulator)